jgi:hypothetical protein
MSEEADRWFLFAREDFRMAELAMKESLLHLEPISRCPPGIPAGRLAE